jgi:hypothetical protein
MSSSMISADRDKMYTNGPTTHTYSKKERQVILRSSQLCLTLIRCCWRPLTPQHWRRLATQLIIGESKKITVNPAQNVDINTAGRPTITQNNLAATPGCIDQKTGSRTKNRALETSKMSAAIDYRGKAQLTAH